MDTTLLFRLAKREDLPQIVRLLADDALGSARENPDHSLFKKYEQAFDKIVADPNQELTVAEMDGEIVGGLRAQIEAVRTNSKHRGKGIGTKVFEYAINRAREKGCHLIQLTTDKRRPDALRFYESLGFRATHEGMKLAVS